MYFGVSWFGTRSFLVEYQDEIMCDLILSRYGPCDLGVVKKKGIIALLTFLMCRDDKIL